MSKKLYFCQGGGDEFCYSLSMIKEMMQEEGVSETKVVRAKATFAEDMFFCHYYGEAGEKGGCGRECLAYQPRNGKSGICTHYGPAYIPVGDWKTIKI